MIPFQCSSCGVRLKAPDQAAGLSLKCPSCGERAKIPQQLPATIPFAVVIPEALPIEQERRPAWSRLKITACIAGSALAGLLIVAVGAKVWSVGQENGTFSAPKAQTKYRIAWANGGGGFGGGGIEGAWERVQMAGMNEVFSRGLPRVQGNRVWYIDWNTGQAMTARGWNIIVQNAETGELMGQ